MTRPPRSRAAVLSWRTFLGLTALNGGLALWQLAKAPGEAENAVAFGLSAPRLFAAVLLALWFGLALYAALRASADSRWQAGLDRLFGSSAGDVLMIAALLTALSAESILAILAGLAHGTLDPKYAAYAARLAPILHLITLSAVEFIGWMAYGRRKALRAIRPGFIDLLKRGAIAWGALALLALFIATTGLGIVPDETGDWGLPAVAFLEWQIVLACLVCVVVLLLEGGGRLSSRRTDAVISALIWLGTVVLWLSQPVNPGFSALPPRAPNFEIYPFFDAQVYDEHAQSILIGNGMQGNEIPSRPLYIVFLALLHVLAGQDYEQVIAAQTLVLAFFPVVLYWIGKELHGRPVGAAMALLAALRDVTSNIAAPFTYALTYSKLYLSELPVAIPIVLFILTALWWTRRNHPGFLAFVAGGILGVAIMIRTQAVVALPVVLLAAWLTDRKRIGLIARGAVLMGIAIALVTTPWIWRNWKNTGQFIFDSPQTQTINLALRYNALNGVAVDVSRHGGEDNAAYNARLMSLFRQAVKANPVGAARVLANRFLNNCVDNLLLFPLRRDLVGLEELVQPTRSFWEQWRGKPTPSQGALLAAYAALLGLGLAATWKRAGLWALVPLGVNLLYHLWTSIALLSGQRFLVSMDWSISMYYMAGLFTLLSGFLYALHSARASVLRWHETPVALSSGPSRVRSTWQHFAAAGMVFFLVGASIPLSEMIFPEQYGKLSQAQLRQALVSSPALEQTGMEAGCVEQIILENGLIGVNGRALSPRFYDVGEGEPTAKLGYAESEDPRLVFLTTGNRYGLAVMEMAEAPEFFPHAADLILFTDPHETHRAWFALVRGGLSGSSAFYASDRARLSSPCAAATAMRQ